MLHLIDTPIKGTPVDKKAGRHGKQKGHNRAREKGNGASRHAIFAKLGHCMSLLPTRMNMINTKMKELESSHFSH